MRSEAADEQPGSDGGGRGQLVKFNITEAAGDSNKCKFGKRRGGSGGEEILGGLARLFQRIEEGRGRRWA